MTPMPEPTVDPSVDRAPGGADAHPSETDAGASVVWGEAPEPLTPDPPSPAQEDEDALPDELEQPEPHDPVGAPATEPPG